MATYTQTKEHHKVKSIREEFIELLNEYEIIFDEKYLLQHVFKHLQFELNPFQGFCLFVAPYPVGFTYGYYY